MEFQENFKFLNVQAINKKNANDLPDDEKIFLKLNALDKTNNPCSFMVFDKNIIRKILNNPHSSLVDISVIFDLVYVNDKWNVKLVDIND